MVHLHERRLKRTLHSTDVQSLYSAKFLLRHNDPILDGDALKGYSTLLLFALVNSYSLNGYHTLQEIHSAAG